MLWRPAGRWLGLVLDAPRDGFGGAPGLLAIRGALRRGMLAEHRGQDSVAVDVVAGQLREHMAVAEHEDARAEADELLDLARHVDDGPACGGEVAQMRVKIGLGADVDAARRIVEDQDIGAEHEGAANETPFCWLPPLSEVILSPRSPMRIDSFSRSHSNEPVERRPVDEREFPAARLGCDRAARACSRRC